MLFWGFCEGYGGIFNGERRLGREERGMLWFQEGVSSSLKDQHVVLMKHTQLGVTKVHAPVPSKEVKGYGAGDRRQVTAA